MLKVLAVRGEGEGPRVMVAQTEDGRRIDFALAREPRSGEPLLRLSTLLGCPVRCVFCDAGGHYEGRLTADELHAQLALLLQVAGDPPRFVVDFSRMGEPAFNPAVLQVLRELPARHPGAHLRVHLSTMGPEHCDAFYAELAEVRRALYPRDTFLLQLSLHTTDEAARRRLIPVRSLDFGRLAALGRRLHGASGPKVALHFAPAEGLPLEPEALRAHFSPEVFRVTLSALHPTRAAARAGLSSRLAEESPGALVARLAAAGYDVQLLPPEPEETAVGASCGMSTDEDRERAPRPRRTRVVD